MIEVGEETGKSPEILKKLAEFYESEVDQISKKLKELEIDFDLFSCYRTYGYDDDFAGYR